MRTFLMAAHRPIPSLLLVVGAAAIAGDLGYIIGSNQSGHPSEPSYVRPSEQPIVDKALDIYGHGKISRDELRKSNDINVVYLPTMTCVGFNLLPGTVGGDDTMCFDRSGQHVVLNYTNGQ